MCVSVSACVCVCQGVYKAVAVAAADEITCSQCVSLAVKVIVAAAAPRQSNLPGYKSLPFGLSLTPIAGCPQSLPKASVGQKRAL